MLFQASLQLLYRQHVLQGKVAVSTVALTQGFVPGTHPSALRSAGCCLCIAMIM